MKPTVVDSRTPNRLILRGPAGDLPPVTAEPGGSSDVAPANSSKQQCLRCHNLTAQITPDVSVIHAIVDKPFDMPTCRC
jgi:hypothetical protein